MPKNKAFTLIELLVVIAIIGLLTTLVLVNTSGTRGRARVAKALEYSSQIYNALGSEAVGIWNFDNGTGTIAYDNSGYGNNGTLTNGPLFATDTPYYVVGSGTGKYSMHFDGADDYIVFSNSTSLQVSNPMSFEFWFKGNGFTGTYQQILWKRYESGGTQGWQAYANNTDNRIGFIIWSNGVATYVYADYTPTTWEHFVGTYDGINIKIYKNGIIVGGPVACIVTPLVNTPLIISSATNPLNGFIDDVRIYGAALTASEIQQHYVERLENHKNLTVNE